MDIEKEIETDKKEKKDWLDTVVWARHVSILDTIKSALTIVIAPVAGLALLYQLFLYPLSLMMGW